MNLYNLLKQDCLENKNKTVLKTIPITSSIWTKVKVLDFNAYVEQLPASQINDGIEVGDIIIRKDTWISQVEWGI